jgi:hypothetical protein
MENIPSYLPDLHIAMMPKKEGTLQPANHQSVTSSLLEVPSYLSLPL